MRVLLACLLFLPTISSAVQLVKPDPNIASYSASSPQFPPVATATDMCEIFGSATKTIKVTSIELASNQSTAGANQFYIIKRSTANSGGASTTLVGVPFDSGRAAATAVVKYYTGSNPTTGSTVGNIFVKRVLSGVSTSILNPYIEMLVPVTNVFQPIVLRGTGEGVAINFQGVAIPSGLSIACTFRWIEE